MNDNLKGQINTYCELIKTGKPAALIPIQNRYIGVAIDIVEFNNLEFYIEELYEGWKTLWIYKESFILEIIKKMPEEPKNVYDHWVLGKLFGYSDEAIKEFLKTIA